MYAKKNKKPMYEMGAMLKKYMDGGISYKPTVLGGQYTSDSPYGDVRRRTVSEGNLNTPRLQREFDDRLEYFMERYPSMEIGDARQEVMKQMAQENDFMSRIDLMETARRGRPSDTQAGKRLMMEAGGTVKYRSGGMMKYEQGGEVSREPKVDIIDNKVLVGGSMIKKQKPGGGFEYVPKPEYANEAMFYVDGVPATFADAKFAFEQTSDAGVGLDFNDYIEKYTKQRGAYDMDLKKQRESLGERAEAAGTPALLRALRDMR